MTWVIRNGGWVYVREELAKKPARVEAKIVGEDVVKEKPAKKAKKKASA